MESLLAFLGEYAILLAVVLAAGATVCVVLLARRFLQPCAQPSITEARIRIDPCDLPSFRWFRGSAVAVNNGRKRCHLTALYVLHEHLKFQISDITGRSKTDLTLQDKGPTGDRLPLSIKGNRRKTIFFRGLHEVETLEALPESLSLEVAFDCREGPLRYSLPRKSEIKVYGLYLFESTKIRETLTG